MGNLTLAAKRRAVELANKNAPTHLEDFFTVSRMCYITVALAEYIQKVSDIAEEASKSVVSDARRWELLSGIVVEADADPLAEQLWLTGEWVGKEGFARIVREAVDRAGLQIVPK